MTVAKIVATGWILLSLCCTPTQHKETKSVEWLLGTWEINTPEGSIYESWIRINDSEYQGKSYMLNEKDTIPFETIRLVQENNQWVYIPTVKDQNNGQPVRFELKHNSDSSLLFENINHDFPQRISYTRIHSDSMVAVISGIQHQKEAQQTYPMRRK